MSEDSKKQSHGFHMILFVDRKDGGVDQMGIGRGPVLGFLIVVAVCIITCAIGWNVNSKARKAAEADNASLTAQIEELNNQITDLTNANNELSNKVTILSDTVNTKVEEQNAIKQEVDEAHFPGGFPLSSSASMTTDDDDPNTVFFTSNEGTSIIATGAGKVTEVIPDADYGYCIKIDHDNGYVTEYYLASAPLIKEGDEVLQGAILSLVENSNQKIAYKVYHDGQQIDPLTIIKIDG